MDSHFNKVFFSLLNAIYYFVILIGIFDNPDDWSSNWSLTVLFIHIFSIELITFCIREICKDLRCKTLEIHKYHFLYLFFFGWPLEFYNFNGDIFKPLTKYRSEILTHLLRCTPKLRKKERLLPYLFLRESKRVTAQLEEMFRKIYRRSKSIIF